MSVFPYVIIGVLLIVILVLFAMIDNQKNVIKGYEADQKRTHDVYNTLRNKFANIETEYNMLIEKLEAKRQAKNVARRKPTDAKEDA